MKVHALVTLIVLVYLSFNVHSQIVGPDEDGVTAFFFNNYSSVYLLHEIYPSLKFHPVLGGEEHAYIRKDNWASFTFSVIHEVVRSNDTIVETLYTNTLNWTLVISNDTDPETGNFHALAKIQSKLPNGAEIEVKCETWSQGINIPYGDYFNNITADQAAMSLQIKKWPFKSINNRLDLGLTLGLDGPVIPSLPDRSIPYIYKGTISSSTTEFITWLMTYGFLDGEFKRFSYRIVPETQSFFFETGYFNDTLFYDPNFAVLLKNKPDCSSMGGCGRGACVEDNTCKCNKGYALPDCRNQGLETDEIGDRNTKSGNSISTGAIIGISVGAVALVVAIAVGVTMNQTRRRREQRKRVNTIVGENQRP